MTLTEQCMKTGCTLKTTDINEKVVAVDTSNLSPNDISYIDFWRLVDYAVTSAWGTTLWLVAKNH